MASDKKIGSLKSKSQKWRDRKYNDMYLPREIILSPAWLSLTTATACKVYLIFRTKCQMKAPEGGRRKSRRDFFIANNGKIQFCYTEAKKYGIGDGAFTRAIDVLVKVGLIDIAVSGQGIRRDKSLYAISERWRLYGTPEFVVSERQKRKQRYNFKKGNTDWLKGREQPLSMTVVENEEKKIKQLSVTVE